MSFKHLIKKGWGNVFRNLGQEVELEGGAQISIAEIIPADSTDLPVTFTLDVSETKSIYMNAAAAMTVKTNNAGAPINTLNLLANQPYIWHVGDLNALLLTVDVTGLFVTSVEGGLLEIEALSDPTP